MKEIYRTIRGRSGRRVGYVCALIEEISYEEFKNRFNVLSWQELPEEKNPLIVRFGWSLCKKGDKFDGKNGMRMAKVRAERLYGKTDLNVPHSVDKPIQVLYNKIYERYRRYNDRTVVYIYPRKFGTASYVFYHHPRLEDGMLKEMPTAPVKMDGPYPAVTPDVYVFDNSVSEFVEYHRPPTSSCLPPDNVCLPSGQGVFDNSVNEYVNEYVKKLAKQYPDPIVSE